MDITPYLDLKIAPRAVFDELPARSSRVRFLLPQGDDWLPVTWAAFAADIRRVALFLLASRLRPGDRAAIYAPNSVAWLSAALGIQAASGVMVPIYASSTAEQAAYVVAHSDARFLFVDTPALLRRLFEAWPELGDVERIVLLSETVDVASVLADVRLRSPRAPALSEIEDKIVTWRHALGLGATLGAEQPLLFERTLHGVSLDQPGLMLYTSGTSGNPKGVPLTHRNVAANGRDWLRCNAAVLEEGAVDLLWLPMSHIFGFGEACIGNTLGFSTYLVDPSTVVSKLPVVRPSVFMSVPSVWEKIALAAIAEPTPEARRQRLAAATGGRLRFCLSGGAGLKREVKELFYESGTLIIEGYGLTETSPTLTLNRPDAFRFDAVGKPVPSVELRLAEDGEILARGPNVFSGYHKDPAATREAFTPDGWFKTGDIGRFTDDGFLQIVDRKKDILVTAGGKNVPPANIELRFRDDPLLSHVVVYGEGKRYLVAGVWVNHDVATSLLGDRAASREARADAIRALVRERIERVNGELASYETIKAFGVMDGALTVTDGLLTPTLKVRRQKVYAAYRDAFEGLYR